MERPIYEIASEIKADWKNIGSTGNLPYLIPLFSLNKVTDKYMGFSGGGKSVLTTFLCNSAQWKGETARRIKAELRNMVK